MGKMSQMSYLGSIAKELLASGNPLGMTLYDHQGDWRILEVEHQVDPSGLRVRLERNYPGGPTVYDVHMAPLHIPLEPPTKGTTSWGTSSARWKIWEEHWVQTVLRRQSALANQRTTPS